MILSVCLAQADETYGFAQALLEEGDHYRAITEYKRYLYLDPHGDRVDSARMAIGLAYLRGGQAEAAAAHYRSVAAQVNEALRPDAELQAAYAWYVGADPTRAFAELQTWLDRHQALSGNRARATYLLGWSELELGRDLDAARRFASLELPGGEGLVEAVQRFDQLPQKSPVLAGILSIIPGAGHVYIGQPMIGLTALLWNGLFGYALYEAITQRQIGLSIALGMFELLWYGGSVFGAVSGAMKFNRDARRNALDDLRSRYDDRPESWPPAPPKQQGAD